MASAVVRIKTAVNTNELVKANNQVDGLVKSIKRIATGGAVGLAVKGFKEIAKFTKQAVDEWAKVDGATSNFVKAQKELEESTNRLKMALVGSILGTADGSGMNSLTAALNKVSSAIEKSNTQKAISAAAGNGNSLSGFSTQDLINASVKLNSDMKEAAELSTNSTRESWKKAYQEIADNSKKEYEAVMAELKKRRTASYQGTAIKGFSETDEKYENYSNRLNVILNDILAEEKARNNEIAKKQFEVSQKTDQDIVNYLMATDENFKYLVDTRDNGGTGYSILDKGIQDAINKMVYALRPSIEKTAEATTETAEDNKYQLDAFKEFEKELERETYLEEQQLRIKKEEDFKKICDAILGNSGELGSLISAGVEGGGIGVLVEVIGMVLNRLSQTSAIINAFFNFVTFVLDTIITPLVNILEPIILPILALIQLIADCITPLLEIVDMCLQPIYTMMQTLCYSVGIVVKVITAIFETIKAIFKTLKEFFTNGFKGSYDSIWKAVGSAWESVGTYSMNYLGYLEQVASGVKSNSKYNNSASSASYTAARDIYINITYDHSYINGDADAIALQLRNDIRRLEKMGY